MKREEGFYREGAEGAKFGGRDMKGYEGIWGIWGFGDLGFVERWEENHGWTGWTRMGCGRRWIDDW
jgi:hypothetical protein